MIKKSPTLPQLAAMALFTLSVFALLLWLWIAFGGPIPLKPQSYRAKAAFPEAALLVQESEVRKAGVVIGKVKSKELADGGQRVLAEFEIEPDFAPIPRNTRAILRQKSLLGETYIELTPGDRSSGNLPDGGRLRDSQVEETVEVDEFLRIFDPQTREYFQDWMREAGIAFGGDYARDFSDSLGNLAPFAEAGTDLLKPLDEQEIALRRLIRDTGRVVGAASEQEGALRGLVVNGNRAFGALASRDEALAETFQVLPTFERETRLTMARLERFARNTDPLVRLLREPADDLAPTIRDLGDLAPDLERLFRAIDPLIDAGETGVPAAERYIRGIEPVLESAHLFLAELNPVLAYLQFNRSLLEPSSPTAQARSGRTSPAATRGRAPRARPSTCCRRPRSSRTARSCAGASARPGTGQRLPRAERQGAGDRPRRDRDLGLPALRRRGAGPRGQRRQPQHRSSLLRGAGVAVPGPEVPAAGARRGAAHTGTDPRRPARKRAGDRAPR